MQHRRTKHINVNFHAIREAEKNSEVNLVHCCSENQIADILTKALSKAKFEELRSRLGVSKKNSQEGVLEFENFLDTLRNLLYILLIVELVEKV